jgi:hypothetical protein
VLVDRPTSSPDMRKRALLLGAVVLVLVVAGVGIWLASTSGSGGGQNEAGGGTSSTTSANQAVPPASSGKTSTGNTSTQPSVVPDSATPPVPPSTTSGTLEYPPAGNKVLAFYSTNVLTGAGAAQGWAMLSPSGQSYYGTEAQFATYWQQFTQISSAHETGLTTNSDGSVQCPADVTYGPFSSSSTFHKNVRVVQVGGQVLIDGDTRIPGTPWPPAPNTGGGNNQ